LGADGPSEIGDVVGGDGHQLPTDLAGFVRRSISSVRGGRLARSIERYCHRSMGQPVLFASPLLGSSDRLTIPVLGEIQMPFGRVQARRREVCDHADADEGRCS
jgi:hypothetical protein